MDLKYITIVCEIYLSLYSLSLFTNMYKKREIHIHTN